MGSLAHRDFTIAQLISRACDLMHDWISFAVKAALELLFNGHSGVLHIGVAVAELKGGMAGVYGRGGFRFRGLVLQGHHHKQGEQHLQGEEGIKGQGHRDQVDRTVFSFGGFTSLKPSQSGDGRLRCR